MRKHSVVLAGLAAACLGGPQAARAVIVGGINGNGLGNATEAGLQADLANRSLPAFPYWGNLLQASDSSGIYLGFNAATGRGWVMTAAHVTDLPTGSGSITVGGQAYTVRDSRIIQHPDINGTLGTDIRLYAIGRGAGDPALPTLPTVPLLATDVAAGDNLILTGRSRRFQSPEDTTAPYAWDFSDPNAREMRWGSNHVALVDTTVTFPLTEGSPVTKKTISFRSVFDDPGAGGTPYEGQLALYDSGGGAFVERGGSWFLAGTNYSVDDGPDGDATASPAGYGDRSVMTHLPTYRTQIQVITGPLVPEPGTLLLLSLSGGLAWRRHRARPCRQTS